MEHKTWASLVPKDMWFHLARVVFTPKKLSHLHTHDFAEIFWIESGVALHEINGSREKLFPGDIVFVRPADRHRFSAPGAEGFVMVNFAFPKSLLDDLQRRHTEIAHLHPARAPMPALRRLPSSLLPQLGEDVRRFSQSPPGRLATERLLLGIYLMSADFSHPSTAPLPDWLARACLAIERPENFAEGVPAFVRFCGRSPEYVSRICRALLGKSPTELVNSIRLAHAARELRLGTRSILEIALDSGFGNLAHFYKLFRQTHHATPRRYRLQHQRAVG